MEVSIVSTALVDITNDLQAFKYVSWVVNAYLLTFTGFLIIWAQFSHAIGRKLFVILAYLIFIAFSGACAGAQTAVQLIVFRAFQGIGGAGVLNMSMVILAEAVLPAEFPKYTAITSIVYTLAFGLGPLIGGGISNNTTWRWVFWINIPLSAVPLFLNLLAIPNGFPRHNSGNQSRPPLSSLIKKLDPLGAVLFLALSVMLVTALEGGVVDWSWRSATSISLLTIAGIVAIVFVVWERFVTLHRGNIVPVMTWRFTTRKCIGMFMGFFLVSTPTTSIVVQIPERFQVLNHLSPFQAGVRLLPFIITIPIVGMVGAIVVSRFKIKYTYGLLFGTACQIAGAALFLQLPNTTHIDPAEYGYQVLLAIGLGLNNSILSISVPQMVEKDLIPSALGAGMQFRYLGAAVGLGVLTAAFNGYIQPQLTSLLGPDEASRILHSTQVVSQLSPAVQSTVQEIFGVAFNLQWKALLGFISAEVVAALLMY
ncbi:MAG: hypothetical protein M1820_004700 [Bogoriella megaspora]|nr:MAG: hypothetical protein M1820_004700 [Bogoriella megaspora]